MTIIFVYVGLIQCSTYSFLVEWLLIRRIIRYHEVLSGYGSHGNNVFKLVLLLL